MIFLPWRSFLAATLMKSSCSAASRVTSRITGGSLTPEVSAAVPGMVEEAAKQLKEWGFKIEPRTPDEKAETLGESCLERKPYEEGRPSEEEACRYADLRFFSKRDQNGNPISEKE